MTFWIIASAVVLVLAAVTVTLLVRESRGDRTVLAEGPRRPDWVLPTPGDIREPRFDLTWHGYDPGQVDALLDAVATAYEALLLAAGPSVVERVERRLEAGAPPEHDPPLT